MTKYEKLQIEIMIWQQEDVLAASGEYEGASNLKSWFSGYFNEGGGEE